MEFMMTFKDVLILLKSEEYKDSLEELGINIDYADYCGDCKEIDGHNCIKCKNLIKGGYTYAYCFYNVVVDIYNKNKEKIVVQNVYKIHRQIHIKESYLQA